MATSLLLSLATALSGGLGILLLVPLLSLVGIGQPGSETLAWLGRLERQTGVTPDLAVILILFLVALTAQAWLQRAQSLTTYELSVQFPLNIQRQLYEAISGTRWTHFLSMRKSSLLQACTFEVERLERAVYCLHALILEGCLCLTYTLVALALMPGVTLVWVACGLLMLAMMRKRIRRAREMGEQISEDTTRIYQTISDHLDAFQVARAYQAQERHVSRFLEDMESYYATLRQANRNYLDSKFTFRAASLLALCLVCYAAVRWVEASPATVVLSIYVFSRLVPNLSSLEQLLQSFLHAAPAYDTLKATIKRCQEESDREPSGEAPALPFERELRLEGVCFSYPGTERLQIEDLSLSIESGRMTALVGASGSGKSTTVDLILGLLTPLRGKILVDGRELTPELLPAWRRTVAYVPQDIFLFHASIRDNLLWARPEATESELWEALGRVQADGMVREMPAGIDTLVGDRGSRLSGGQAQRLALARALVRRPRILILDEATSALDEASESQILAMLRTDLTILMITHRAAAACRADQVLCLESGRRA